MRAVTFTSIGGTATNAPAGFVVASSTSITGVVVPAGLPAGAYFVNVTTAAGVSNAVRLLVGPTAVASAAVPTAFRLSPNPAHGAVAMEGAAPHTPVRVIDALGRRVATATTDASGTAQLLLSAGLAPGVYVVRCGSQAQRLVVE